MRGPRIVTFALVSALFSSCASGPALRIPDPPGFERAWLIDVHGLDQFASVDAPSFEPAAAAALDPDDRVVVVESGSDARAYPVGILVQHQIVNDEIGDLPIAVTYCVPCDAAVAYERTVAGSTLTFGVSGKLYLADLVLYDRETRSMWPQILGIAALGELKGQSLTPVPSSVVTFDAFRAQWPEGDVLAPPTSVLDYDVEPPAVGPSPEVFLRPLDPRLAPTERVVGVAIGDEARAFPSATLQRTGVAHDRIGGSDVVVFHREGTAVFEPAARGVRLTFEVRDGAIHDRQTGSSWSILGTATAGPLAGERLRPVHHVGTMWYVWAGSVPRTTLWSVP